MNQSRSSFACSMVRLFSCSALGFALASCAVVDLEHGGAIQPPPAADQETRSIVDRVKLSGELPPDAKATVQSASDFALDQTFGPSTDSSRRSANASCFAAGCVSQVVYRDRCAEQQARRQFVENASSPIHRWPGPVYRSPPVARPDGGWDVTWALFVSDPRDKRFAEVLKPTPGPPAIRLDICKASDNQPSPANPKVPEAK
jgi:hypothetical protein